MNHDKNDRGGGPAFLLSQVGAHAAALFSERLKVLDLAPSDAGILRLLRVEAGLSQQELAAKLKIHPSRLVAILDALEKRGIVERRANPQDRRLYSLYLTKGGEDVVGRIGRVAREHQEALLSILSSGEREALTAALAKLARHHGLTPGVHPGYRRMGSQERQGSSGVSGDGNLELS